MSTQVANETVSKSEENSNSILILGRLSYSWDNNFPSQNPEVVCFRTDNVIQYVGFTEDFGPMSLASIFQFCTLVENKLNMFSGQNLARNQ